jgi:hypothetical protein
MANYKKSFNFRNGVQVDEDNFVVNANGLVGIGTTIPESYLLNVYGDTRVTGLVTATSANIGNLNVTGISTVGVLSATNINASGVVTATTFYGSAAGLTSIYAIAVDGWHVTAGSISTVANVGVGTTLPTGTLQVGVAVTINSNGNATYIGIITASSFDGIGSSITQINASNISSGTLSNDRLPSNINVSGVVTAYSFSGFGTNISGINASNISLGTLSNSRLPSDINVSGIITASKFSGPGDDIVDLNASVITSGTLSNSRLPSDINVSGIVTASGGFVGNVTGIASTAQSLTGSPSITVSNITASNLNASGIITATTLGVSGLTTTTTLVSQTSIGIGTNLPIGDFQIKNATAASLLVTSDTQSAVISIGRSNSLESSNGVLRFGNTSGLFPYSNGTSLDIINYSTGNVNFYLEAGTPGIGTGNFYWHRRKNFSRLMTLTYDGNLGIGLTNPSNTLSVNGIGTFTSSLFVGSDLSVSGNLNVIGPNLTADTITATNVNAVNLSGNITITGNQSFTNLNVSGFTTTNFLRVNVIANPSFSNFQVNEGSSVFNVFNDGKIGIKTSIVANDLTVDCSNGTFGTSAVGVGTTTLRSAVDFADAGKLISGGAGAFIIVPRLTTTQRGSLSPVNGAVIYNTTTNIFQGYANGSWVDFH